MSKHTPGPWNIRPLDGKYYGTEIECGDSVIVVWTPNHYVSPFASEREIANGWEPEDGHDHVEDVQSYANARLIAAAPDLLKEISNVADWLARPDERELSDSDVANIRAAIAKATGGPP